MTLQDSNHNNDKDQNFMQKEIQEWLASQDNFGKELWEELVYLRNRPLKKRKYDTQTKLDRPVAVFSKPERLKNGMGTEITLIFRSSACSWAKSKSGGCTMCGYWNDRAPESITGENYWNQFQVSLSKNESLLKDPSSKIVFKMFTSGSFCDTKEIPIEIQLKILKTLGEFSTIKEIVIESRPEYITKQILEQYKPLLGDKYFEIGVGLESSSDFIRMNLINKGFNFNSFLTATNLLHSFNFGIKAYLLFKPPFINEYGAIYDTFQTVRICVENNVDTISINPANIQMHTLSSELEKARQYRSPWLFSLLWLLKHSITNDELKHTRVICDPSAAGKDRGVHNCHPFDSSNDFCLEILHKFVETQNIDVIPEKFEGSCWDEYVFEILLENR